MKAKDNIKLIKEHPDSNNRAGSKDFVAEFHGRPPMQERAMGRVDEQQLLLYVNPLVGFIYPDLASTLFVSFP